VEAIHEAVFTSASKFRAPAEAYGMRFVAAPAGAADDMSDIDALFPERKILATRPPGYRAL